MLPRITVTDIGKRFRSELKKDLRAAAQQVTPLQQSPRRSSVGQNQSATILRTNDDRFCDELRGTQQKIAGLASIKGKDRQLKYLKETLMPSLQSVELPRFFEKKLQDSADQITSYYICKDFGHGGQGNLRKGRNISREEVLSESLKIAQTFESKMIRIYNKYETFKLNEARTKAEIQARLALKIGRDESRQFVDSRKVIRDLYEENRDAMEIIEGTARDNEWVKRAMRKVHVTRYEAFWKKVRIPERSQRVKTEFDYSGYQAVLGDRLASKARLERDFKQRASDYYI